MYSDRPSPIPKSVQSDRSGEQELLDMLGSHRIGYWSCTNGIIVGLDNHSLLDILAWIRRRSSGIRRVGRQDDEIGGLNLCC
jgi:hypothetical protein